LEERSVTHFNAAPTVLSMLTSDSSAHRLPHRVRVCTGGAPPSPTLIEQMTSYNLELVHLYGLTETFGPLTISVPGPDFSSLSLGEQAAYKARQGFAHSIAGDVRVVTPTMEDV